MTTKPHGGEPTPPSPAETTIVHMGEWKEGQGDTILEAHLGPCIGVAIYEPGSKRGFLVHDPSPQESASNYQNLEDHLRLVFRDQPEAFERMQAWLSGGSPILATAWAAGSEGLLEEYSQPMADAMEENKAFVVEGMEIIGIPPEAVHTSWTPDDQLKAVLSLDCATGNCTVSFSREV